MVTSRAFKGKHEPMLRKRSVSLAGHATSLALEPEFWAVLDAMARAEGRPLAAVLAELDAARGPRPLASACRLAALRWAQGSAHPVAEDGEGAGGEG